MNNRESYIYKNTLFKVALIVSFRNPNFLGTNCYGMTVTFICVRLSYTNPSILSVQDLRILGYFFTVNGRAIVYAKGQS